MYLTHTEYTEKGGKLSYDEFARYEYTASKEIDENTSGRVSEMALVPEDVKWLAFELIELISQSPEIGVASETIGNWSKSYASGNDSEKEKQNLIRKYLSGVTDDNGTPLLYRGL